MFLTVFCLMTCPRPRPAGMDDVTVTLLVPAATAVLDTVAPPAGTALLPSLCFSCCSWFFLMACCFSSCSCCGVSCLLVTTVPVWTSPVLPAWLTRIWPVGSRGLLVLVTAAPVVVMMAELTAAVFNNSWNITGQLMSVTDVLIRVELN